MIAKAPSVSSASQTIPIHYSRCAARRARATQILPVGSSDSVMFSLCGLGRRARSQPGKASVERGTLVRREILELALYTFKYVGGVETRDRVHAADAAATQPTYVVYLQKATCRRQLKQPLVADARARRCRCRTTISPASSGTIDRSLESRIYKFGLSQAQQGDAMLVLAPFQA